MDIKEVIKIVNRISMKCLGVSFFIRLEQDNVYRKKGRKFLQIWYYAPCTHTGENKIWYGRKYYLSDYMTADEIVKTAYVAFESAVKHEIMEGFKVDGKILFNPHVNFEELLKISELEVKRTDK